MQGGLFGNKATGFGTPAASTGFSFGQPATTSSLFAKPTTSGTTGFGGFGATSNAGFGELLRRPSLTPNKMWLRPRDRVIMTVLSSV